MKIYIPMDCIFLSASFDSSISLAIRKTWSLNAELISAINIIFDNCDLDGTNLFIQIDSSAEKLRILTAKKGTYDILDVLKKMSSREYFFTGVMEKYCTDYSFDAFTARLFAHSRSAAICSYCVTESGTVCDIAV